MKKIYEFIKKPIYLILNIIITGLILGGVYYARIALAGAYKPANALSLLLLLLCASNVWLVYKDPDADTPTLFKENISGIIFFIGFVACKMILRG